MLNKCVSVIWDKLFVVYVNGKFNSYIYNEILKGI